MFYEATLNTSGWHVYRVAFIRDDLIRVCIASFGYGPDAEWKAVRAVERLNNGAFA